MPRSTPQRTARLVLAGALAGLLPACAATTSPQQDARFGDAVRSMRAQQSLDPAAPARNAGTLVRSDGRSAREAMGRYVESFKAPVQPLILSVGTGTAPIGTASP